MSRGGLHASILSNAGVRKTHSRRVLKKVAKVAIFFLTGLGEPLRCDFQSPICILSRAQMGFHAIPSFPIAVRDEQ